VFADSGATPTATAFTTEAVIPLPVIIGGGTRPFRRRLGLLAPASSGLDDLLRITAEARATVNGVVVSDFRVVAKHVGLTSGGQ
jgi:hypothetical protein